MEAKLSFQYDREADILYISKRPPYPEQETEELGDEVMAQMNPDTGEIEKVVDQVLAANPKQAEQLRSGDKKVIGWLVGQIMKASGGKANPKMVNDILAKKAGG